MAQSFSASIDAWVAETKERMTAVRNIAVEKLVEVAQQPVAQGGNMPIDTGFLRASMMATTGAPPPAQAKPAHGGKVSYDPGQVTLVLAGAKLTDTVTIVWTANYARFVNYGTRGHAGRKFRDLAAQQWPQLVAQAAADVKARAGA